MLNISKTHLFFEQQAGAWRKISLEVKINKNFNVEFQLKWEVFTTDNSFEILTWNKNIIFMNNHYEYYIKMI